MAAPPTAVTAIQESVASSTSAGLHDDVDAVLKDRGTTADSRLFLDSRHIGAIGEEMGLFQLRPESRVPRTKFFERYRESLGLNSINDQMVQASLYTDAAGFTHTRWEQVHRGLPVLGRGFTLMDKTEEGEKGEDTAYVKLAVGRVASGLDVDPNPTLTEAQALDIALNDIGAETYAWEEIPNLDQPSGRLAITSKGYGDEGFRLVFQFVIATQKPMGAWDIQIDAKSGEIVNRFNAMASATSWDEMNNTPVEGETFYNGHRKLTGNHQGDRYLLESRRDYTNYTLGLQANMALQDMRALLEYYPPNEDGNFDNPLDKVAVSVKWGLERSLAYFATNFPGWNGMNGKGGPDIKAVLGGWESPPGEDEGAYFQNFGNDAIIDFKANEPNPHVDLATVGHEFTHGVIENTSKIQKIGEAGAINEGFANLFAVLIRHFATHEEGDESVDWRWGDYYLDDPSANKASPHPDTHLGSYYYNPFSGTFDLKACETANDQCGVHQNSTVLGHAFYLLAKGGTGVNDFGDKYEVQGIGVKKTAQLAFLAMTRFYSSSLALSGANASFEWLREIVLQLAREEGTKLSAGDSGNPPADPNETEESLQVKNAFQAVGVGPRSSTDGIIIPEDGAKEVRPWPVEEMGAEIGPEATACEIELFENGGKGLGLKKGPEIKAKPAQQYGKTLCMPEAPVYLEASRVYLWRVRTKGQSKFVSPKNVPDWGPWSERYSFMTSDLCPTFKSPASLSSQKSTWMAMKRRWLSKLVPPWPAELVWTHEGGPDGYELRIATTIEGLSAEKTERISLSNPLNRKGLDVRAEKVLKIGTKYFAELSAINQKEGKLGRWCTDKRIEFNTATPKPSPLLPADGVSVNPWDFSLSWQGIPTRQAYNPKDEQAYEVAFQDSSDFSDATNPSRLTTAPQIPHAFFPGEASSAYWAVRAKGPAPYHEKGPWSMPRSLNANYALTQSQLISPLNAVLPYNDVHILFRWKPVTGADGYKLLLFNKAPGGGSGEAFGEPILVGNDCSDTACEFLLYTMTNSGDQEGKYWQIVAYKEIDNAVENGGGTLTTVHEGMPSVPSSYAIGACMPGLVSPKPLGPDPVKYDNAWFEWTCNRPETLFKLKISPPYTVPQSPVGSDYITDFLTDTKFSKLLEPGKNYQYSVLAYTNPNDPHPIEGGPTVFTTKAAEPPPEAEQPKNCPPIEAPTWHYPMFDNQTISGHLQWRRVEGAVRYVLTRYDFTKCLQGDQTACSTAIDFTVVDQSAGWPVYNYDHTKVSYYVIDSGDLTDHPISHYVASIRAVNACGDMSPDSSDSRINYWE